MSGMGCPHDLDAEYLYPSDVDVLELQGQGGDLVIRFALPCPECGQALELEAGVEHIEESDLNLPLDDAEDVYD